MVLIETMNNLKRVVVIEDDKDINELLSYNLRKEGFGVVQVFDGQKAYDYIAENRYDLVILDLMLPGRDGYEICEKIRRSLYGKNVPVIIVSAKTEWDDEFRALKLGADYYVEKPFDIKDFLSVTREAISKFDFKNRLIEP